MSLTKFILKHSKKAHKKLRAWAIREEKMLKRQWGRFVKFVSHFSKFIFYTAAVVLVLVAVSLSTIRVLLPKVIDKKPEIEKYLSKKSGYHVTVDNIQTYWKGLHPGISVNGVQVYNKDKKL